MKPWKFVSIGVLLGILSLGLSGCDWNAEVEGLREASQQVTDTINDLAAKREGAKAELVALQDEYLELSVQYEDSGDEGAARAARKVAERISVLSGQLSEYEDDIVSGLEMLSNYNQQIQEADDWLDIVDVGIGALAVAFPGVGIAIPFWRRGKEKLRDLIMSVEAGGGPREPEATKTEMLARNPKLLTVVKKTKAVDKTGVLTRKMTA